jgi:RNA 2',3'-cyclic 3'-phosphodiesterase
VPRLFVAAWPPDDLVERVAALDRPAVAGLRWTTPDQWHVTLRFLGQVPEEDAVVGALAGLSSSPAVDASVGPQVDRFDQRVLQLPVAGLVTLAADVVRATAHLGQPPEDRPFSGHLTLARVAKSARVDLRPLTGSPLAAAWRVHELCLVESRLSSAGARYSVIARVPLAA